MALVRLVYRKLVHVALVLLLCSASLVSPDASRANPSTGPVIGLATTMVNPCPGTPEIRPGSAVVFDLKSLGTAHAEIRKRVGLGKYCAQVYESDPAGDASTFCVRPGNGCDYDQASDLLRVTIPNQKPFCHYLVLVMTGSGQRPKIWPIDADGQRIVLNSQGGDIVLFGSNHVFNHPGLGRLQHRLMPGDRLVQVHYKQRAEGLRRLDGYPLSMVFATGSPFWVPEGMLAESSSTRRYK